jgi:hypothetical protein
MDPLVLLVGVVVLIGGALWAFTDVLDFNKDGKVDSADVQVAVEATEAVIKKQVAEVKAKLPATKKMKDMTKAKLEELGREFSIELDKRKTKDKMITDLRAGVKALNKQLK